LTRALIAIAVLALAAVAAAGWVSARSGLSAQREAIRAEWPNVSGALGRRAELVANLAQAVKSVAGPGDPVFDDITSAGGPFQRVYGAAADSSQLAPHAGVRAPVSPHRTVSKAERRPGFPEDRRADEGSREFRRHRAAQVQ